MKNDDIIENVLQCGKEGVKQNIMEALDEFCDEYADEMYRAVEEIIRLRDENAVLRERLSRAVELPSGDRVWFITEDEEGKESYVISKPTGCLTVNELYEIGKKYFTTCEAAKKVVEELKRRDKNG